MATRSQLVAVAGAAVAAGVALKLLSRGGALEEGKKEAEAPLDLPPYTLMDGNATRKTMLEELGAEVEAMKASHGIVPGLAVVIVGERKDSQAYVRMKKTAAKKIGFHSVDREMPGTASEAEILAVVQELNADPAVRVPNAMHGT